MKKTIVAGFIVAAAVVAGGAAWAADAAKDTVTLREGLMQAVKIEFMAVKAAVDAGRAPDAAAAEAAENLAALARIIPKAYEGTEKVASGVKPEVWSKSAEFKAASEQFRTLSLKLSEAAKGSDAGALKTAFAAVGKECKACHDTFRK